MVEMAHIIAVVHFKYFNFILLFSSFYYLVVHFLILFVYLYCSHFCLCVFFYYWHLFHFLNFYVIYLITSTIA